MSRLRIVGLQTGLPRTLGTAEAADPMDRVWTSGIFKEPCTGPRVVSHSGVEGDGQADRVNHGGTDKAVNAYPREHYPSWSEELGLPLPPGAFGENLTTAGLVESEVCIGDVFSVGALRLQVSQPRQPCWKLSRRWRIKDLAARVERSGRTGWYFRVLAEGPLEAGATLELLWRPCPEWTVALANEVMHRRKNDADAARALAACGELSESWRDSLACRAAGIFVDESKRLEGN